MRGGLPTLSTPTTTKAPQNENNDENISPGSSTSPASATSNEITPSITPTVLTTTTNQLDGNWCDLSSTPFNVLLQNPSDCNKFYMCTVAITGEVVKHELSCPPNLLFNEEIQVCDWPANVTCKIGS